MAKGIHPSQMLQSPGQMSGGYVVRSGANLVYSPDKGIQVWLYENSTWKAHQIPSAGTSVGCTGLTTTTAYYLYVYNNSGTLALDLSTTSTTSQDGVLVKNGSTGHLLLAYCYTDGVGDVVTVGESSTKQFLNNIYNKKLIVLTRAEPSSNWAYSTATWRPFNNSNTNRLEAVCDGVTRFVVTAACTANSSSATLGANLGIDEDGNSSNDSTGFTHLLNGTGQLSSYLATKPAAGYHYWQMMETATGNTGTITWYGTSSTSQSTIRAEMMG